MFPRDEDAERLAAALPVPSDALDRALGLLLQRKRYTLVERVARRALPLAPDAPVVLASLISASLQTGARDGLGEAAAHLAEVDRTPQAILLAANGEVAAGDPAAAEKLLAVALDRGPDLEISVLAARLALERGDPGRAQAILDLALARAVARADKARLHGERALLEDKLGNHARATAERALAAGLE
jgi:hypothetical protein